MSLIRALAKVAAGVVVAKAVKGMVSGAPRGGTPVQRPTTAGGGLDDLLGQVFGGGPRGASGGSIQDVLGQVLAGRAGPAGGNPDNSLGAELDKLSRMSRPGQTGQVPASQGNFGKKLNEALENFGEPEEPPSRDEEELAGILLRATIQAAKADGRIDAKERQRLFENLGDVGRDELDFVNQELKRDTSPEELARSVPKGAEQQVYMMSAMAIDLDQNSEARYLHDLAGSLHLNEATVNAIHDRLQLPRLYR